MLNSFGLKRLISLGVESKHIERLTNRVKFEAGEDVDNKENAKSEVYKLLGISDEKLQIKLFKRFLTTSSKKTITL